MVNQVTAAQKTYSEKSISTTIRLKKPPVISKKKLLFWNSMWIYPLKQNKNNMRGLVNIIYAVCQNLGQVHLNRKSLNKKICLSKLNAIWKLIDVLQFF